MKSDASVTSKLPRIVARTINQRAHQLALTYEARARDLLIMEARRLAAAGAAPEHVLAVVRAYTLARE